MRKVIMRPSHFGFHRDGAAPRFRVQSDEATAHVRLEFAASPQLLTAARASARTADNYFDSASGAPGAAAAALRLAAGKLSYELPAPVWGRLKAGAHIFYRATASSSTPPSWNGAPPATVRSVHDSNAAGGYAYFIGVTSERRAADPWRFPDPEPLAQVPLYHRSRLELLTQLEEAQESAYLLRRLAGHPNYTSLHVSQRSKALLVFSATSLVARRALLQLFERNIPAFTPGGTAVAAVRSLDASGRNTTLLDQLVNLVEVDLHLDIPEANADLIGEAIEEVADPSFEINQARKNTCVPTSVSWIFATYFPAEYVRLVASWLSETGSAQLANGDVARLPADSYRVDPNDSTGPTFLRRSWSERVFQASMMSYARPGMSYANLVDMFADRQQGLTLAQLCRLLQGLRNLPHREVRGSGADLASTIAERLARPTLPVLTTLSWGGGLHEVVSVQSSASEVTIRNPWGGMQYRVGQVLAQPTRRSVNPSRAEEALTRADLVAALHSIVVEG